MSTAEVILRYHPFASTGRTVHSFMYVNTVVEDPLIYDESHVVKYKSARGMSASKYASPGFVPASPPKKLVGISLSGGVNIT